MPVESKNIRNQSNGEGGGLIARSGDKYDADIEALNSAVEALSVNGHISTTTAPVVPSWLRSLYPECYFTWISSIPNFGEEDARTLGEKLTARFSNVGEDGILKELKYLPFDVISSKLANAFCHLFLREFESATKALEDVEDNISRARDNEFIESSQRHGFSYLVNGLKSYQKFLEGKIEEISANVDDDDMSFYSFLTPNATVVVRGLKAKFYAALHHNLEEQFKLLGDISKEDPKHCREWKLMMNVIFRQVRRDGRRFGPTAEAKEILSECLQKEPDHIMVKFAVTLYLGELLRSMKWNYDSSPIILTDKVYFENEDQVRDYLKTVTQEVLENFGHSKRFNLDLAELLIMTTPRYLQDLKTGKECLERAVAINPTGSKENHRMGLYLYVHEKNYDEGLKFVRKAYDVNPRNFPAFMDTLQLMMRDMDGNASEILEIFDRELKEGVGKWNQDKLSNLYALYGVYCFMSGNREEVIDALETAFKMKKASLSCLKTIRRQGARYGWKPQAIRMEDLRDFIFSNLDGVPFQTEKREFLECAVDALNNGIEFAKRRALNKNSAKPGGEIANGASNGRGRGRGANGKNEGGGRGREGSGGRGNRGQNED